jgi:hypothetical protein
MSLESCLPLTAKILVEWVIFVGITLAIWMDLAIIWDTPATLVAVSSCCHSLMVVLFYHFLHSSTFGMVWSEALWSGWLFGEWWHHEKLCCAAGCSNLQNHSTMMDLMTCHSCCQIPHSIIGPRGLSFKILLVWAPCRALYHFATMVGLGSFLCPRRFFLYVH